MLGTPNHCDGLLPGMVANLKISQGPCAFEAHAFANLKVPGRRNAALEACRGSMACIEMHWNVKIVKSCQIEKHGADNQPPSTIVIAIALVWKVFPECPWHWVAVWRAPNYFQKQPLIWWSAPGGVLFVHFLSVLLFHLFWEHVVTLIDCGWCFLLGLFNIWKSSRAAEKPRAGITGTKITTHARPCVGAFPPARGSFYGWLIYLKVRAFHEVSHEQWSLALLWMKLG